MSVTHFFRLFVGSEWTIRTSESPYTASSQQETYLSDPCKVREVAELRCENFRKDLREISSWSLLFVNGESDETEFP